MTKKDIIGKLEGILISTMNSMECLSIIQEIRSVQSEIDKDELFSEYYEMKRGLDDIMIQLNHPEHLSIRNSVHEVEIAIRGIMKLQEENKKLSDSKLSHQGEPAKLSN